MKGATKKPRQEPEMATAVKSVIDLEEQIRRRAYELYEQRGREDGHDIEDWLQAEAELASESIEPLAATTAKPPATSTGKRITKRVKKAEIIGAE